MLRVESLRAMNPRAWVLIARAGVDLAVFWIGLRTVGYRRLLDSLESRSPAPAGAAAPVAPVAREDVRLARRYARLIGLAARVHPLRPHCLERSLTLHAWLRRHGLPSRLRLGVRRDEGTLKAHAWVELGTSIVNDRRADVGPFVPLGRFGLGAAGLEVPSGGLAA